MEWMGAWKWCRAAGREAQDFVDHVAHRGLGGMDAGDDLRDDQQPRVDVDEVERPAQLRLHRPLVPRVEPDCQDPQNVQLEDVSCAVQPEWTSPSAPLGNAVQRPIFLLNTFWITK